MCVCVRICVCVRRSEFHARKEIYFCNILRKKKRYGQHIDAYVFYKERGLAKAKLAKLAWLIESW